MSDPSPWGRPDPEPPSRPRPSRSGRRLVFGLAAAACGALFVWVLTKLNPDRPLSRQDWTQVIYLLGFTVVISTSLFSHRLRLGQVVRYGLIWIAIAAVLLLGFSFRDELGVAVQHMRSELAPSDAIATAPHELAVTAEGDGHFYVMGAVNGTPIRFLIDTGASGMVLSPLDARRLGVDTAALTYGGVYETANGVGHGAPFGADTLTVGPIVLTDVAMSINQAPMSTSLLGMDFLRRLESFEIRGRRLFLRWRS
jgi:aspartyl protease family protein